MKRIVTLILAAVMVFSLTACGSKDTDSTAPATTAASTTAATTAPAETTAPAASTQILVMWAGK